MKLEEIYQREIDRYINPAVVVSEMDRERIDQEIKEYVFSKELVKNMYTFLNAIVNKREGKTGIWITGYYGSGKSHFIKYLFYLLNKEHRKEAFEQLMEAAKELDLDGLSEVTLSNIEKIQNYLDKTELEEIIFNVDKVSGSTKKEGTLTRIFYNQLNKKRGYNTSNIAVALLIEKHLDKMGKFDDFKRLFKEKIGEEWDQRTVGRAIRAYRSVIIDIAHRLDPNLDKDALNDEIRGDANFDYSPEQLVQELNDYVAQKDENFRLIFLMDEVSQYIGDNKDLLLNLQTLVEEISKIEGKKVWVVCTAQEDTKQMDEKSGGFGKISGRFETKISLDSQDAAYITQKRILEKNSEGLKVLTDFYHQNKSVIENQFVFDHDLYQNYKDADSFYLAYPFIPYQFRLISDVFQSFNTVGYLQEGVKNTERSILGITHYTAAKQKQREVGYFISLDDFFNDQFSKNLTINANNLLNKALQIKFDKEEEKFANRVIRVLFMISNLSEDKNVNFPATTDNITLLLINDVNTVKQQLRNRVQKVLDVLVAKNVVQSSEGSYKFLDDDEMIVATAISAETINTNTRSEYFYDDFIKDILKPNPRINIGEKDVKAGIWIDDKRIENGEDLQIKFVLNDTRDVFQQALTLDKDQLNINLSQWFMTDTDFRNKFLEYCKTTQYYGKNRTTATGRRVQTLEGFAQRNSALLKDLQSRFEKKFKEITYSYAQNVYAADTISANVPAQRYKTMVDRHVEELFKKHKWSKDYKQNNAALQSEIKRTLAQGGLPPQLTPAEQEIENFVMQMGGEYPLSDIVRRFEKPPHGWKDIAILHIVFNLVYKKKRRLTYQNEDLELEDYFDIVINSRSRDAVEIKAIKGYDPELIKKLKDNIKDIFIGHSVSGTDVKDIIKYLKEHILAEALKESNTLKKEYDGFPFSKHLTKYYDSLREIFDNRSEERLIESINSGIDRLKKERDNFVGIKSFIDSQIPGYQEIRNFVNAQIRNLQDFEEEDLKAQADDLQEYFRTDDMPDREYPRIRKIYKNLQKAIKDKSEALKNELLDVYEKIFEELEAKKEELKIEDAHILPDKDYLMGKIKSAKSISDLELLKSKASDFRADELISLTEYAARLKAAEEGEDYKMEVVDFSSFLTGQSLTKPEEVDAFVEKIKAKLMVALKKNGKIILK